MFRFVIRVLTMFSLSEGVVSAQSVYSNPGGELYAFVNQNKVSIADHSYITPVPLTYSAPMAVAQVAVMPRYYPVRGSLWSTPTSNHPFYSRHAAIKHLMNEHGYSEESLQGYSLAELNSLHSDAHEGQVRMMVGPVVSKPQLNFNQQAYYSSGCPGGVCPTTSRREARRNR